MNVELERDPKLAAKPPVRNLLQASQLTLQYLHAQIAAETAQNASLQRQIAEDEEKAREMKEIIRQQLDEINRLKNTKGASP